MSKFRGPMQQYNIGAPLLWIYQVHCLRLIMAIDTIVLLLIVWFKVLFQGLEFQARFTQIKEHSLSRINHVSFKTCV